jgi:hypothetical protein
MNTKRLFQFGIVALLMASASATNVHAEEASSFRIIPIPKREHGYSNFNSAVIASQNDLDMFLQKDSKRQGMGWNNREDFEKTLARAKIDFNRESLVLLRHTEGSGSVQVNFRKPLFKEKRIICLIDRKEPEMGTADMAYYCFALAVAKTDVTDVELRISGRTVIILSVRKEETSNKRNAGDGK